MRLAGNEQYSISRVSPQFLAFLPGDKVLMSQTHYAKDSLWLWDVAAGKPLKKYVQPRVVLSADGRLVAWWKREASLNVVEEVATGAVVAQMGSDAAVQTLALSRDGNLLAEASARRIACFDVGQGKLKWEMPVIARRIFFSPDGASLVTERDGKTVVREAATGKEVASWVGYPSRFSDDGAILEGRQTFHSGLIELRDAKTWKKQSEWPARIGGYHALSPDKRRVALTHGLAIEIRDAMTGIPADLTAKDVGARYPVRFMSFSPDSAKLACSGDRFFLWDVATRRSDRSFNVPSLSSIFLGDSDTLLGLGPHGLGRRSYFLFNLRTDETRALATVGEPARTQTPPGTEHWWGDQKYYPLFSGNRFTVVSEHPYTEAVSVDAEEPGFKKEVRKQHKFFCLWNSADGTERLRIIGKPDDRFLALSHDHSRLATVNVPFEGRPYASEWDARTGKLRFSGSVQTDGFPALYLWRADRPGYPLRMWDLRSRKLLFEVYGSPDATSLNADQRLFFFGDGLGAILCLETWTGEELLTMKGHDGLVASLAVSADGNWVASGGHDTTVMLWDLPGLLKKHFPPKGRPLADEELVACWQTLAKRNGKEAYQAMGHLAGDGEQAVAILKTRLAPEPDVGLRKTIAKLIDALDDQTFAEREKAMQQLRQLAYKAEPHLEKAMWSDPSLETKQRLEKLLQALDSPKTLMLDLSSDLLRGLRAVQVLETIATPNAAALLKDLATGDPDSRLTQEARRSLDRLGKAGAKESS